MIGSRRVARGAGILAYAAGLALSIALPAGAAMLAEPGAAANALQTPRTIAVGPGRPIKLISIAAQQARDGDTIEIDAGVYYADVAVWTQDRITIRGVGGAARLVASGAHAEGKGIWVIRGGRVTVENIEFADARVPDHNGAGIRFEKGHLTVRNCLFENNENGLLTGSGDAQLDIEDSEFANNGNGDGYTHQLYVGAIKRLSVRGSYFHHARVGHLLKSRAAENVIINNRLTDEVGGRASYEMEFPNGGIAYVIGNIVGQSSTTSNAAIIAVGAEGYAWPRNELYLINNTIANDRPEGGVFVSAKPGLGVFKGVNNVLIGKGDSDTATTEAFGSARRLPDWRELARSARSTLHGLVRPDESGNMPQLKGQFANNVNADWDQFALASRHDYRIRPGSRLLGSFVNPGTANGLRLAPDAEYRYPRGTRKLNRAPSLPGALQTFATEK